MRPVFVFTTKYIDSALTALGKAMAAGSGIRVSFNLFCHKVFTPPYPISERQNRQDQK